MKQINKKERDMKNVKTTIALLLSFSFLSNHCSAKKSSLLHVAAESDWRVVVAEDWEQIITRPKKPLRCDQVPSSSCPYLEETVQGPEAIEQENKIHHRKSSYYGTTSISTIPLLRPPPGSIIEMQRVGSDEYAQAIISAAHEQRHLEEQQKNCSRKLASCCSALWRFISCASCCGSSNQKKIKD